MPKPIKKRVSKQEVRAEDSVRSFLGRTVEFLEDKKKQVGIAALVVVVAVIAVAGFFLHQRSQEREAREAFYEGYKYYYALYDTKVLPRSDRMEKALENFRRSYDAKGSAEALMYVANSQSALGQDDESLASLEELLKTFPEDEIYVPLALYKASMIKLKQDKPDEALVYLDRLYSSKTDSYKDMALAEAGGILESLGREEEAKEKYRALLELYPDSPFADEARFKTGGEKAEGAEEPKTPGEAGSRVGSGGSPGQAGSSGEAGSPGASGVAPKQGVEP
ncbi:MAG: tetratricopeptide repeat protein [Nitrospirota bacterium]|jgi:predicted negative regulator of RcsB-dependent stress response